MNKADKYFIANLEKILKEGVFDENPRGRYKSDGMAAYSKFITQVFETYDLSNNEFPIPTLNPTAKRSGISEILWIYQDQSNVLADLKARGVHWWDDWDIGDGTIGQRYGATVKKYNLMNRLLLNLEKNPYGRRHMINLWQEQDFLETDGLPPCAFMTEWSIRKKDEFSNKLYLDMHLNQRSNDYLMAGYINKVQYVALQMMVAGHLRFRGMDIEVGKFSHYVNNLHIYNRHIDVAEHILKNRVSLGKHPKMVLINDKVFTDYTQDDIFFFEDDCYPRLKDLDIAI